MSQVSPFGTPAHMWLYHTYIVKKTPLYKNLEIGDILPLQIHVGVGAHFILSTPFFNLQMTCFPVNTSEFGQRSTPPTWAIWRISWHGKFCDMGYTSPNLGSGKVSKYKTWLVWHDSTHESTTNILVAYYRELNHLTPIPYIQALVVGALMSTWTGLQTRIYLDLVYINSFMQQIEHIYRYIRIRLSSGSSIGRAEN